MTSENHENRRSDNTRERILDSACRLFADKGYRGTTIAQICRMAGANIAAVNYHFGGKEKLYQRAWKHAHDQLLAMVPFQGGVEADRPAAERLQGLVRAGLQRAMLGNPIEFRIMRNEVASPTGLLSQIIQDAIRPLRQTIQDILRELLGPDASQRDIELCEVCVVSPLMHVAHQKDAEQHVGLAPIFGEEMIEDMTKHFSDFALAGIQETRRHIEMSARTSNMLHSENRKKR